MAREVRAGQGGLGGQPPSGIKGGGGGVRYRDQYWSRGERVPVPGASWVLPTSRLQEAGKRPGSTFVMEGLSAAPLL